MSKPTQDGESALADLRESEDDYAENAVLRNRPVLSLRLRLGLFFSLIFCFCLAVTLWSIYALSEVQSKFHFLETAGNYLSEIQQARRFEKNYLLYRTNLRDAQEHVINASRILEVEGATIGKMVGKQHYATMKRQLREYGALLERVDGIPEGDLARVIEPDLRSHGAQMISFAEEFVTKERESVQRMLYWARRVPFIFLAALVTLMAFILSFLVRQLMRRLASFMEHTERIGHGDFTPIMPQHKYRDEFSELSVAFNRMIHELDRRQRILVESHKLRAMGTLVAGVAHELNNPLNNTMLTACTLQEDLDVLSDGEKQEMIRDVINETERSQRIVRNLLDFARETEATITPLQIEKIVEDSVRLVANHLKLAKVLLKCSFEPDLPAVHGDAQMLEQVFVNLLLNAIDVLPTKGEIEVTAYDVKEKGFVAIKVRDNGVGIPEHILSRIFDPFFTTKKSKGTGLGLSVSQGIVKKLGGFIEAKSEPGKGSAFTVYLPVTDVPSAISSGENHRKISR